MRDIRLLHYPLIEAQLSGPYNRFDRQQYLVWLMARWADATHGRGWLATDYLGALCHAKGILVNGAILESGNGRYWTVDEAGGRIYLHGMKRVAGDLFGLHPSDVKGEQGDVGRLKEWAGL